MDQITNLEGYDLPVGRFSKNFLIEVMKNKDSFIYYEDEEPHELKGKDFKAVIIRFYNHPLLVRSLTDQGYLPIILPFACDEEQLKFARELPKAIKLNTPELQNFSSPI